MAASQEQIAKMLATQFDQFESQLNGEKKSAIHQSRRQAFDALTTVGLPEKKNEEYKYSYVAKLFEQQLEQYVENPSVNLEALKAQIPDYLASVIYVFVNGEYQVGLSKPANIPGLHIKSVKDAFESNYEAINALEEANREKPDGFNYLNNAFAQSGLHIEVEKGKVIEETIAIINITDSSEGKVIASPRHIAFIGQNSQATIADVNLSFGDYDTFSNTSLEVNVAQDGLLNLYTITKEPAHSVQVNNTYIRQHQNSVLNAVTIDFDGKLIRNNLRIDLSGEFCESNLSGLYMPSNKSQIDNHTTVDHQMANSNSNELYKGILDDESTGVFNGKIFVRQDAQKTNAFQSNKNILLTDEATINTKPQLEIWADDVKCSHGCTTGQLDNDQLFYLRARGIGADKARAMLLHAFAEEVIEKIKPEPIRQYLESILNQRIDIN